MTRILIGTPCYNTLEVEYVLSLLEAMKTCGKSDIRLAPVFPSGSILHNLRNKIVAMFLAESTATHLLFIDSGKEWYTHGSGSAIHNAKLIFIMSPEYFGPEYVLLRKRKPS